MKYLILLLLCNSTFFLCSQSASKYMNDISEVSKTVLTSTWEYTNSVAKNKGVSKVENERQNLISTIQRSEIKINEIGDFKGNSVYKDSVLSFLQTYEDVISIDFEKIKVIELNAKNSFDLKDKYIQTKEDINTKMLLASEMLEVVEQKFADDNQVRLVKSKSKIGEKLKKANKVYKYYNSIFLVFFNSYYQESLFLEALDKEDLNGMEQCKTNFISRNQENLAKLNLKLDYEGDMALINLGQNLLSFYVSEEKELQKIIDFQIFKANYKKTKSDLEAKPSSDRAKGEVANFNKLVAEYNQKMAVYNDLIIDLNNKREVLVNEWNKIGEEFQKKHLN